MYLFTFSDTSFSGGTLTATIGADYSGGANYDVTALTASDQFGQSVALAEESSGYHRLAVGAIGDDGSSNFYTESGAVYLLTFTNDSYAGASLAATIGYGYSGGSNLSNTSLGTYDYFGSAVALDGDGDLLAVGAYGDDGSSSSYYESGAVYLYSFANTIWHRAYKGTIGRGYSGNDSIDHSSLGSSDQFGRSVALDNNGDRLVVGAIGDDGNSDSTYDTGAVYSYSFSDSDFSSGSLEVTLGSGYTTNGMTIDFDEYDYFGGSVALTSDGERMAVGAYSADGVSDAVSNSGEVYLLSGATLTGEYSPSSLSYAAFSGLSTYVDTQELVDLLTSGTAVTLQASNDITVSEAISATGTVSALTLQAGRSVLLNESISTAGDLTIIANDLLGNGVIDADRDSGDAVIAMASGKSITADDLVIAMRAGTGLTNADTGDITLRSITAATSDIILGQTLLCYTMILPRQDLARRLMLGI